MTAEKITPAEQAKQIDQLVRSFPHNSNKAKEYGEKNAKAPLEGLTDKTRFSQRICNYFK